MPTLYRASQFCIADGIDKLPGYTDGSLWNGWACPYFSRENAERALTAFEARYTFDTATDTFTIWIDDSIPEPETYTGNDILTTKGESLHVYGIGAFGWTWEETTNIEAIWELTISDLLTNKRIMQDRFTDSFIFEVMNMYIPSITVNMVISSQNPVDFSGYTDGVRLCTVREVSPYRVDVWSKDRKLIVSDSYVTFDLARENFESEINLNDQADVVVICHDRTIDYCVVIEA